MFDVTHNVDTRADYSDERLSTWWSGDNNYPYLPTRARTASHLVGNLPIADYSEYTFVDFGSGKGRVLLLAAEHPFRSVHGVEVNKELHEQAVENIRNARRFRRRCNDVRSYNIDATKYDFPLTPLALYFFNPFGRDVMKIVLERLRASLGQTPRDALVMTLAPHFTDVTGIVPELTLVRDTASCLLYRTGTPLT